MATEEVSCSSNKISFVFKFICLFFKGTLGPIKPAIRTNVWSVEVVGTTVKCLTVKEDFTFVSNTIVVDVREFPNLWWCTNVQRAVVPLTSLRKHHFVSKDGAFVKDAVSVGVFESQYSMWFFFKLVVYSGVRAARFGNVQASQFVKRCGDRTVDQWRASNLFDGQTICQSEYLTVKLNGLFCNNGKAGCVKCNEHQSKY